MPILHRGWHLLLLLLLPPLLVALAYQVRLPVVVDVGALGDRAYLWASPLSERRFGFNGDERLIEEGVSYRWTKWVSWLRLPDLGWDGPFQVSLRLRSGRPTPSIPGTIPGSEPPRLEVRTNGVLVGTFPAPAEWEVREFPVSEFPGRPPDLQVSVECTPTFSLGAEDPRTLGVQLDWVRLSPQPSGLVPTLPPWRPLLLWTAGALLLYLALRRPLGLRAFWAGLAWAVLAALGLAFFRLYVTPYALPAFYAALALFLLLHADFLWRGVRKLLRRARSLPFYALLPIGLLLVLGVYIRWAVDTVPSLGPRPDAVLLLVFFTAAVLYALSSWFEPLKDLLARFDALLRGPWLPPLLLALLMAGLTAYELAFIQEMQFIGHADYADNAVVARNLLAGRGFTVDYAAQFYRFYPGISHPQETWPLLQPVLIAPFFHFLGDSPLAAKLPNLILQPALVLALYIYGSRFFDRRVGMLAALLAVFNRYTFRLIIFPTNDLAFTLFALLMLGQFFWATEREQESRPFLLSYLWAGVWAGLMMLSKPNGALFVAVALLWDLVRRRRGRRWAGWWKAWLAFLLPAGLLFSPWVLRNLLLFGSPIYSTEQFDAWILKYQDWEEIYRIYFRDPPERSWLLRYGFDRVFEAVAQEFRRWWLYFSRDAGSLLTLLGSFLALGGALTLRGRAARFFSLVGAVFLLFGTFICTYWHVEERYFVPFIPWLALLVARGLWWGHDALAYRRGEEGRSVPTGFGWLGLLLLVLAALHLTASFPQEAAAKMEMDRGPAVVETQVWDAGRGEWVIQAGPPQGKRAEIQAYRWLARNSPPEAVVMTRVPWQFTYYSGRRSVMIPQGRPEEVRCIAELYGVDYLLMEGDARTERPALQQALQRGGGPWTLLHDEGGVQIYTFTSQFQGRGLARMLEFLRSDCGPLLFGDKR
ncbi:MAG: ArnT family glycosyltransferase [Chloroflexia bacterium]